MSESEIRVTVTAKTSPETIALFAKVNGMSVEQYLEWLKEDEE